MEVVHIHEINIMLIKLKNHFICQYFQHKESHPSPDEQFWTISMIFPYFIKLFFFFSSSGII